MSANKEKPKLPFPIHLILLDFIGMMMVCVGIIDLSGHIYFVPEQYRFENYAPTLIIVGVLLMLPIVRQIFRLTRKRTQ